jgi:isopenicillin-N N-acyltransferase-like protein
MTVPFVRADGEPYEVGYRHGASLATELRAFLADDLARINRLAPSPMSLESLRPALASYSEAIASAAPRLSAEIDGLADGAGISRAEAVLLQTRREVIGYQAIPARGDCTTYAIGGVLAQTVDLNGDLEDQIAVLDIGLSGAGRRALLLSFGGLLGYLGVNTDGLAIGLNLVLGGQWGPGLPPYLAIRHLLDNAGSVADALDVLRTLPLASSRSLMLSDTERSVCVEILGPSLRVLPELVHTNHFLHPDFASQDQLNVFARNSSLLRLRTAAAAIADLGPHASVEDHFAVLCQAPIRVEGNGDIRRERTVAAVVMLPGRCELHLRPGDPLASSTQTFRFPVSVERS